MQAIIPVITESQMLPDNAIFSEKARHDYTFTTNHAASSYGNPVLVSPEGKVFGADDVLPNGAPAWYVVKMSISSLDQEGQDIAAKFIAAHREPEIDPFSHLFSK